MALRKSIWKLLKQQRRSLSVSFLVFPKHLDGVLESVNAKMYNLVLGSIKMNNQEVIQIAKECGLVYNNNHDILEFYQRIRKELKKEFQTEVLNTK
jgi:hypothetical protein